LCGRGGGSGRSDRSRRNRCDGQHRLAGTQNRNIFAFALGTAGRGELEEGPHARDDLCDFGQGEFKGKHDRHDQPQNHHGYRAEITKLAEQQGIKLVAEPTSAFALVNRCLVGNFVKGGNRRSRIVKQFDEVYPGEGAGKQHQRADQPEVVDFEVEILEALPHQPDTHDESGYGQRNFAPSK